ncbi:MAG: hypothetical protein J0G30_07350 [Actinomycetales bacterium]|nr:hypothetical protein [Actinomycetales bacterium]
MRFSPYVRDYRVPEEPGDAAQRTALGAAPLQPVMPPAPWVRSMPLAAGVAAALLVAGVAEIAASSGFPWNAPVESFLAWANGFGVIATAVALGVVAVVWGRLARRRARDLAGYRAFVAAHPEVTQLPRPEPRRPWRMALVGLCLAGGSLLVWLLAAALPMTVQAISGERLRYMLAAGVLWLVGAPWLVGLALSVVGARRDGGERTRRLALGGVALGLCLPVPALVFTVLYTLQITD